MGVRRPVQTGVNDPVVPIGAQTPASTSARSRSFSGASWRIAWAYTLQAERRVGVAELGHDVDRIAARVASE
jgi:hypothetical protein